MSTPTPNVNPKTFTIVDPTASAEGVTGMNVKFGRTTGGPYTLVAPVPAKDLSTEASGTVTGALSDLESTLAPGNWFAVATAVNSAGESAPTAEFAFSITPPLPSAPTSFTLA